MAAIMAAIIPLFIPHEGCRHACSFCNQRHTRQEAEPITAQQVRDAIRAWLSRLRPERKKMVQVAFYGGSFTALPGKRQRELLEAVQPFLQDGRVHGIRLSTRPDCVDADTVEMLRDLGVHLIELGVQSCDDAVLAEAGRGHSHSDSLQASRLIRAAGLQLGWQIMVGMPGACIAHFVQIESNVIVHINMLSPEPLQFFCHVCITYEIKPCTWGKNVPADRKDGIVSTTNLDKRCAGIKDKEKNR